MKKSGRSSAAAPAPGSPEFFMKRALRLAEKGRGKTSPNPMVGAVLVRAGRIIGEGWHRKAGLPHAEIEALADARRRGEKVRGSTIFVTLEPCCTFGRTPPCTQAILAAGIRKVFVGAVDPNPDHAGRGLDQLKENGIQVVHGVLAEQAARQNEAFFHWIVKRRPWVIVKAAMTLDGKIATASGESQWITGEAARRDAMRIRKSSDAILVGVETVLKDDPELTVRQGGRVLASKSWKRVVLDTRARIPVQLRLVSQDPHHQTVVVVGGSAPAARVKALRQKVMVWEAPLRDGRIDPAWVLDRLGTEKVTQLLVEGGGEVQGAFVEQGLANRVVFYYATKILGGSDSRRAVAGKGAGAWPEVQALEQVEWSRVGEDLRMTALVAGPARGPSPAGEE